MSGHQEYTCSTCGFEWESLERPDCPQCREVSQATSIGCDIGWRKRIDNYHRVTGFPESLFIAGDGRVVGIWIMGNDYRVKSEYYGGYPATYLKRVKALMFDKTRVLHLFSGKVDTSIMPGVTVDLNPDNNPDYVANAETLDSVPLEDFDLVLADPPYSIEDAEHYGTPMVNRNKVVQVLGSRLRPGCHVIWLDQAFPMFRKDQFALEGTIGMWKSTNHRFRGITIFGKLVAHQPL